MIGTRWKFGSYGCIYPSIQTLTKLVKYNIVFTRKCIIILPTYPDTQLRVKSVSRYKQILITAFLCRFVVINPSLSVRNKSDCLIKNKHYRLEKFSSKRNRNILKEYFHNWKALSTGERNYREIRRQLSTLWNVPRLLIVKTSLYNGPRIFLIINIHLHNEL